MRLAYRFRLRNPDLDAALASSRATWITAFFQPVQIAATVAINTSEESVKEIIATYKDRRDCLCDGLNKIGGDRKTQGNEFVWGKIPPTVLSNGLSVISKLLLDEASRVSPAPVLAHTARVFVRFALVENEHVSIRPCVNQDVLKNS
jgi:alanine-synthesizing transaminase